MSNLDPAQFHPPEYVFSAGHHNRRPRLNVSTLVKANILDCTGGWNMCTVRYAETSYEIETTSTNITRGNYALLLIVTFLLLVVVLFFW